MIRCRKCGGFKAKHYGGNWTPDLIYELFAHLSSINATVQTSKGKSITVRKYYYQAWQLLRYISLAGFLPPLGHFIIALEDLTPTIVIKLLDSDMKDYIITQVVERFLQNANSRLYEKTKKIRGRGGYTDWAIQYSYNVSENQFGDPADEIRSYKEYMSQFIELEDGQTKILEFDPNGSKMVYGWFTVKELNKGVLQDEKSLRLPVKYAMKIKKELKAGHTVLAITQYRRRPANYDIKVIK